MLFETISYLTYGVSLVMVFLMFQQNARIKPDLPERIPVHFNLRGRPDRYARSSALWVYLLPTIALLLVPLMWFSFHWLPSRIEHGEVWWEYSAVGGAITLSVVWLMYRVNTGMMRVALGEEESVTRYYLVPLIVSMLASFVLPFTVLIDARPPELIETVMCADIDREYNAVDVREDGSFTATDPRATIWLKWLYLQHGDVVHYDWYTPEGALYRDFTYEPKASKRRVRVSYANIDIAGETPAKQTGEWRVAVQLNAEPVVERAFSIE